MNSIVRSYFPEYEAPALCLMPSRSDGRGDDQRYRCPDHLPARPLPTRPWAPGREAVEGCPEMPGGDHPTCFASWRLGVFALSGSRASRRVGGPSALTLTLSRGRAASSPDLRASALSSLRFGRSLATGGQSLPMRASTKGSISKSRRSSRLSPIPISLTGMPSLAEMATTMPPLEVPSSLVRTRPEMSV